MNSDVMSEAQLETCLRTILIGNADPVSRRKGYEAIVESHRALASRLEIQRKTTNDLILQHNETAAQCNSFVSQIKAEKAKARGDAVLIEQLTHALNIANNGWEDEAKRRDRSDYLLCEIIKAEETERLPGDHSISVVLLEVDRHLSQRGDDDRRSSYRGINVRPPTNVSPGDAPIAPPIPPAHCTCSETNEEEPRYGVEAQLIADEVRRIRG